jgi:hypothetical protein
MYFSYLTNNKKVFGVTLWTLLVLKSGLNCFEILNLSIVNFADDIFLLPVD